VPRTTSVPPAVPAAVPEPPPPQPPRDWWVVIGMSIAAASAAVASFSGLYGLATLTGWPVRLAWLLPLTLDAHAMTSARIWLANSTRSAAARRFARANALGAIAMSITGNATYHAIGTGLITMSWPIVVLVGAVPAAVLGLTAHLHALRGRADTHTDTHTGQNEKQDEPRDDPVPAGGGTRTNTVPGTAAPKRTCSPPLVPSPRGTGSHTESRSPGTRYGPNYGSVLRAPPNSAGVFRTPAPSRRTGPLTSERHSPSPPSRCRTQKGGEAIRDRHHSPRGHPRRDRLDRLALHGPAGLAHHRVPAVRVLPGSDQRSTTDPRTHHRHRPPLRHALTRTTRKG
jgi:hypothetical protein